MADGVDRPKQPNTRQPKNHCAFCTQYLAKPFLKSGSEGITTMDIMAYCCANVHKACIDRFTDRTRVCPIAHPALKRAYVDIEKKIHGMYLLLPDDTCTSYKLGIIKYILNLKCINSSLKKHI